MPRTVREVTVEARLAAVCRARGWICRKWVSPGHRGVPDRIVIIPPLGEVHFVELKAPRGCLRPWQKRELKTLSAAGCNTHVIRSVVDVDRFACFVAL
jgi:hypothetical protein